MKKPNYISPGDFSTTFFDGVLRSKEFDDIYFSPLNGEEESNYVFLEGNNLRDRLTINNNFTVGELGFGTGLNFLLTWKLFNDLKLNNTYLDYISIEGYPLPINQINKIYERYPKLVKLWIELKKEMPPLWSGTHRIILNKGRVRLTLIYSDALEALKLSNFSVNAWFLDGFNPNKNKDIWSMDVMQEVYRLTKPSGTFATFSSAGFVRRNLEKAGFNVKKIKGFKFKKEMSIGQKKGKKQHNKIFSKYVIVGGGIAGASIAQALRQRGQSPLVIEKNDKLAQGASGNIAAVQYPRLTTVNTPAGRLSLSCYRFSRNLAKKLGVAINDKSIIFSIPEREAIKHNKLLSQGWPKDLIRKISKEDKLAIANFDFNLNGIVHDHGGTIEPVKFVNNLMPDDIEIIFGKEIHGFTRSTEGWTITLSDKTKIKTEILILTCSDGLKKIKQTSVFNLQYTQGQVTHLDKNKFKNIPSTNFSFSGYLTPPVNGIVTVGATFEKNSNERSYISEEASNINLNNIPNEIFRNIFSNNVNLKKLDGRVSMRVSTFDRMPMMGQIEDNLYILSALGARGMIMAPLLGEELASIILGLPIALDDEILKQCDPIRVERSFLG